MRGSLPSNNNNGEQQPPHFPPRREATIDDLPDELLGLIFRQLPPWLHRVRVEGVSKRFQRVALAHGWADVREFSTEQSRRNEPNELQYHPTWWGPLLDRVGPHLTTLELGGWFGYHHNVGRRGEALRVELEKCPRVKHLSVCWQLLDPPTALEHIGRAYATTLKSLVVCGYYVAVVRGLSETLSNLTALEYLDLCIEETCIPELQLSASLSNLHHLSVESWGSRHIFSEENIDVVVALPHLRSFTLSQSHQFSFLKRFPHLEHLGIGEMSDEGVKSLIEALPHLGRTLKALGLSKYGKSNNADSIILFERLLAALFDHLPLLEHLEVVFYKYLIGENMRSLLQKSLLDRLASSPRLQNLRSLSLHGLLKPLSWAWLEGMSQRLEYLQLGVMPPLSTLCSIVRNAKNLRGLNFCGNSLGAFDRKLLVEASYAPANGSTSEDGGNSVVEPKLVLPTLLVGFSGNYHIQEELEHENSTISPRLQFRLSQGMHSHVLDFYRFGCLTDEDQTSFIRHRSTPTSGAPWRKVFSE